MKTIALLIFTFLSFVPISLGTNVVLQGKVGILTVDTNETNSNTRSEIETDFFLKTDDKTYSLHITYKPQPPLNSLIIVHGNLKDGCVIANNHTTLELLNNDLSFADIPTISNGNRSVGVFFFKIIDNCGFSTTVGGLCKYCYESLEDVQKLFYSDPSSNVRDFYHEMSNQQLNFLINETSVFLIETTDSPPDLYAGFDDIVKAETGGIAPQDFDHAVFILPWNWYKIWPFNNFNVGGVGETPGARTWINNCREDIIAHELGHNLDFGHSNAFYRDGREREYGDASSVMGSGLGRFKRGINSVHKDVAGWIPDSDIIKTNSPFSGIINPLNKKGLRVIVFEHDNIEYYIEYRIRYSYDSHLSDSAVKALPEGVFYNVVLIRILKLTERGRKDSLLLAILDLGDYFDTPDKNYTISHLETLGNTTIQDYFVRNDSKPSFGIITRPTLIGIILVIIIALIL